MGEESTEQELARIYKALEILALDAAIALFGADIITPATGFIMNPRALLPCIKELRKQRDDARAELARTEHLVYRCEQLDKENAKLHGELEEIRKELIGMVDLGRKLSAGGDELQKQLDSMEGGDDGKV